MKKSQLIREKNKLREGIELDGKIVARSIRVFVVELLRYGDKESHHYITGVYSTYKAALKNAREAMDDRGGKYDAQIFTAYIDEPWKLELYRVIHWGDEF